MNYKLMKLGAVSDITKLAGFEFTKYIKYNEEGEIIALRALNLRKGELDLTDIKRIDRAVSDSLIRSKLYLNDILLTYTGNGYGDCAIITENDKYHLAPNICKITPNTKMVDPYFLYSYIRSNLFYQTMSSNMTGSSQPTIPMKTLRVLEVPIPAMDVQRKIGSIIKSIDEKIRNNSHINRNLSEQMQAIFASIFYPEIEAGNKVSLGDYLYIKGRIGWKGLKKDEYLDESEYRIINGESLTATGIDWAKAGYISEERYIESPEIMLQEGDILISKDGTIGKIGYVNRLEKPTSVASGIFVVRNLKPEEVSTVFIFCLLNSDYFKGFIASRTEGSVIPHLYQKDFVTLEIPLLTQEQLNIFNGSVNPLFELYFKNQTENIQLTALRDTLLPRLMSGELDVSDIDI